jgi:uncharacterized protein with PQ loop repeat
MSASTVLGLAASAWAVMMALAPLLQVREITARGTSDGISAATYRVLLVGFGLWVAYGLAAGNLVLVVPNSLAAVVAIATLGVIRRYRLREPAQMPQPEPQPPAPAGASSAPSPP